MKINTSFPAYMPDVSNSIKEGYIPVTTKNSLTIKLFPEDINGLSGFGLNVDVNFFEWQELSIISRKAFLYSNIKNNILSVLEFGHCFFYDFDNEDFRPINYEKLADAYLKIFDERETKRNSF